MYQDEVKFIKQVFNTDDFIPLHEPKFIGNEKLYLNECIDSTFVSSVGKYVDKFEEMMADYTGANYAIATVNGTSALHMALLLAGVQQGDEVITQSLTFVATCNAVFYCGAMPVFVDVDKDTMGLSPDSLLSFLQENAVVEAEGCRNKVSGRLIKACVPMHTFGHPCRISEIKKICEKYNIDLIEDAAESLGSSYEGRHTGTFGKIGVFSFNGNKIVTAGGGGCIVTDNREIAERAKHLTTTAKLPHKWEYTHDLVGYNYRMPNLNAALIVAQLENLDKMLKNKRELASTYETFFSNRRLGFVTQPENASSNYWLNAVVFENEKDRDLFLEETNASGVMTRPIWTLMNKLEMFKGAQCADLANSLWLEKRIVNIPSSVRL